MKIEMITVSNHPFAVIEITQPKLNHGTGPKKNGTKLKKKYIVKKDFGRYEMSTDTTDRTPTFD